MRITNMLDESVWITDNSTQTKLMFKKFKETPLNSVQAFLTHNVISAF